MLHELKNPRQIPEEGFRRWFTDENLDLVVWYPDQSLREILGFQLSYDKRSNQHALTWTVRHGFLHSRVDDGEIVFGNKMSPVLVPAAGFAGQRIQAVFVEAAANLEYGLVTLVSQRVLEFDRHYNRAEPGAPVAGARVELPGQILLDGLRDAFYGPGLHGPSLLPSLREHGPAGLAWQIALHCAYSKHNVTRQLEAHLGLPESQTAHRFELADWVAAPENPGADDWRDCLEALTQEHEALAAAARVLAAKTQGLLLVEAESGFSWAQFVSGMAAHDVYHTAQLRNAARLDLRDA